MSDDVSNAGLNDVTTRIKYKKSFCLAAAEAICRFECVISDKYLFILKVKHLYLIFSVDVTLLICN